MIWEKLASTRVCKSPPPGSGHHLHPGVQVVYTRMGKGVTQWIAKGIPLDTKTAGSCGTCGTSAVLFGEVPQKQPAVY